MNDTNELAWALRLREKFHCFMEAPHDFPLVFCSGARRAIIVDPNERRTTGLNSACRCLKESDYRRERKNNWVDIEMQSTLARLVAEGHKRTLITI
jgi:hypothetical protein